MQRLQTLASQRLCGKRTGIATQSCHMGIDRRPVNVRMVAAKCR